MHNGIPWWLVLVLEAIHYWPVTLALVVLAGAIGFACWRKRRKEGRRDG